MKREKVTITETELLYFKVGTIIDTNGYNDPTFLSLRPNGWVNSNTGYTMSNEELFKFLQKYDAPVVVVDSVYRPTMQLLIDISDNRKKSSPKTKNPFRTSQMY